MVRRAEGPSGGFTLVEVLISLVIFSVVVLGIAGLSYQVARRSNRATSDVLTMAVLFDTSDRVETAAFDSLPTLAGCSNKVSGPITVSSCVTVTDVNWRLRNVTIVVTPQVAGARPDTMVVRRAREPRSVPLKK
jgi:prepilin-type N-terminal cleavage/methylation domain-containing protein